MTPFQWFGCSLAYFTLTSFTTLWCSLSPPQLLYGISTWRETSFWKDWKTSGAHILVLWLLHRWWWLLWVCSRAQLTTTTINRTDARLFACALSSAAYSSWRTWSRHSTTMQWSWWALRARVLLSQQRLPFTWFLTTLESLSQSRWSNSYSTCACSSWRLWLRLLWDFWCWSWHIISQRLMRGFTCSWQLRRFSSFAWR